MEVVSYLLDQGADINAKVYFGYTSLYLACAKGHLGSARAAVITRSHYFNHSHR